jgi:hypothetical protein
VHVREKKNEISKFVEHIFKEAKSAGFIVGRLRADGAGENDKPLCLTWDWDPDKHGTGVWRMKEYSQKLHNIQYLESK